MAVIITPWRFSLITSSSLSSTTLFLNNISISVASNRRLCSPFSCSVKAKSKFTFATPQKYVYPDPIPEFAEAETNKFKKELLKKLSVERETFGNDLNSVVEVCSEIFGEFLREEYGGPGTLVVEPFTNMLIALKDNSFLVLQWLQGLRCCGLKIISIKTGKSGTQNLPSDYYSVILIIC